MRKKDLMFTNKKNSQKGIMSAVLGILSVAAIGLTVFSSFQMKGNVPVRFAATIILAMVFAVVGIVLAIQARMEKDMFYLFPNLGILLNVLAVIMAGGIVYLGVFGI